MRIFIYEYVSAGGLGVEAAESLRREGRAMLDAIVEDFRSLPGVEVVTLTDDTTARAFAEAAAGCEWTLVIAPEFDDLLLSLSQAVLDAGGRLLGPLPGAIQLTADKLATAKFWKATGVRHPQTQRLDPAGIVPFALPWVMKPRFGAGSQATFLVRDFDDVPACVQEACSEVSYRDFIVQQHIAGHAASVALLIGPDQTLALMPARQHLSEDGRFRYLGGSLPLPQQLAQRASRLALQSVRGIDGLQGYVGVDLVLGADRDGGDDHAIEINPRLTTSYIGLRQLYRRNLAELMLGVIQGERILPPAWDSGAVRFGPEDLVGRAIATHRTIP